MRREVKRNLRIGSAIVGFWLFLAMTATEGPAQSLGDDVAPRRMPIWQPARPGEKRKAEELEAAVPVPHATRPDRKSGGSDASTDVTSGSKASIAAHPNPRLASQPIYEPGSACSGEPWITEGPGGDLTVVLPPCQPAYPFSEPPRPRFWTEAHYLMWWMEGSRTPALVTSGTGGSTGVLGDPNTAILFGDRSLNSDRRSGGRLTLGSWFDTRSQIGIEGEYFILEQRVARFGATSTGDPILARPFFNVITGVEDSHVFAFPNAAEGTIDISAVSRLQGAGLILRKAVFEANDSRVDGTDRSGTRVDFLAGYRFMLLDEDLVVREFFEAAGPTSVALYDAFDTKNEFHGADLGVVAEMRRRNFSLELLMRLALGSSSARVVIDGATTTTVGGGAPATTDGGMLALTTNSGQYTQNELAVIPELGATIGYDFTERLRATFGYTFIYWSRVARPGDQIDRNLNPTYFPGNGPPIGAPQPEFAFVTTDMWIQGMNFGVEYRF